jgi:antitoxin component HigA of HigAB toxin-antitoxin module
MTRSLVVLGAVATLSLVWGGCGTRVEDCNKVIAVHNSQVEEAKKIEIDKPGGAEALATLMEKKAGEMAALQLKDETVKTKTAAIVEADKKHAAALRAVIALKAESEADAAKAEKANADMTKAAADVKAASDGFDSYCK